MRYQVFLVNIAKRVHVNTRRNYIITNIWQWNSGHAKFTDRLPEISSSKKYYYNENRKFHKQNTQFIIPAGLFYGLLELFKSDDEKVPALIMDIKRAILSIKKGEFRKAEQLLHVALREAQTLQHYNAITYIYDVMANLAFDTEDYKKAEKLFLTVLERLFSKGVKEDDLKVIHISLKMAKVYEASGNMEKADIGYQYCLEKLNNHVIRSESENEHVVGLLGMTSDWYAHMLFAQAKYEEALKYYLQAYQIYTELHTTNDEQTVILLNDLGAVNFELGKYDKAIKYLQEGIRIGKTIPDMVDSGSLYVNLGNVFIKQKLYDEAKKCCERAQKIATGYGNDVSLKEAEICLEEIKNLMA